jgi:hypothetical protein
MKPRKEPSRPPTIRAAPGSSRDIFDVPSNALLPHRLACVASLSDTATLLFS